MMQMTMLGQVVKCPALLSLLLPLLLQQAADAC
jgi:hypothetical protein